MVDSTGTVVWEARYKPFGEAQVHSKSTVVNNFRFPGQYYDSETGLHYNYHRDYHPGIGRYAEPDPIGFRGGINLYAYVRNNPLKYKDPRGLFEWETQGTGEQGNIDVWAPILDLPKHYPGDSPNPDNSKVCIECDRDCFGLVPPPWALFSCVVCMDCVNAMSRTGYGMATCALPCATCAAGIMIPRMDCIAKYCRVGLMDECGNCRH